MQNVKFVNELKLRASFGAKQATRGGIGLYDYVQSLNVNAGGRVFLDQATSISVTNYARPCIIKQDMGNRAK